MVDASERGWGEGWPAVRSDEMVDLVVGGISFPGGVHPDIAPLMEALIEASIDQGWLTLKDGWCWGYANRPIKTPTGGFTDTPSNHSWGLAIDINAPENPFGGTTHAIPEEMGAFWETFGFRWGGHYDTTQDWMHFEFMGTPEDVLPLTEKARGEFDMLTEDQQRTLDWAEGMRMFFRGEEEPLEESTVKRGWNDAQRVVLESKDDK